MATPIPPISQVEYTDSEGVKHTIEKRWHITTYFLNGVTSSTPGNRLIDIYVDGKFCSDVDETSVSDPFTQAQEWIEEQIREGYPPQSGSQS